jgi:hypothetical protein
MQARITPLARGSRVPECPILESSIKGFNFLINSPEEIPEGLFKTNNPDIKLGHPVDR